MREKSLPTIDINCDLGEGQTLTDCKKDAALMPYISRCNIACGGHAGNPDTMRQTLKNAYRHRLKAGAHPSYPDRANFGRKSLNITQTALLESIKIQVDRLISIATDEGITLAHIKCHGALYNDAESQPELAEALVKFFRAEYPDFAIMGLANGAMQAAAGHFKQPFIREGFMDRAYQRDGKLVPRTQPGAVYKAVDKTITQAVLLAKGEAINSIEKSPLSVYIDSICLHGDNPNAQHVAKQLFDALKRQGISVA